MSDRNQERDIIQPGADQDCYLVLDHISKKQPEQVVLHNVNLTIRSGRIIGMIGDNGIGKTTLLKIMVGLQHPSDGKVLKNIKDVSYVYTRDLCYSWMKVSDALKLFRNSFEDFDYERAERLIADSQIPRKKKLSLLSEGQSERLFLILALCRRVKVYLMDEPLSGVDPHFKKDFRQFILQNIEEDSTVIIATHLLKDLEQIFDEVIFVTKHRVYQMEAETIRSTYHKSVEQFYLENIRGDNFRDDNSKDDNIRDDNFSEEVISHE